MAGFNSPHPFSEIFEPLARTPPPQKVTLMTAPRETKADFVHQEQLDSLRGIMKELKRDMVQQLELVMRRELEEVKAAVRALHHGNMTHVYPDFNFDDEEVDRAMYFEETVKTGDQAVSDRQLTESSEGWVCPPEPRHSGISTSEIFTRLEDVSNLQPTQILKVVTRGDTNTLQFYLDNKLDPNEVLHDISLRGHSKNFTHCSLLASAVMAGRRSHVNLLIDKKASINNSTYGFLAGVLQNQWSGPAVTATVVRNDLPMLKLLLDKKADLAVEASNGANFIWQCAYFGKSELLKLCLSYAKVSERTLGKAAEYQNQVGINYTPLHISVVMGQESCSSILLEAKASVDVANEELETPLGSAIRGCRPELVTMLVKGGAQIAEVEERKSESSVPSNQVQGVPTHEDNPINTFVKKIQINRNSSDFRLGFNDGVERLFDNERNPVLVLAVALGLQSQPEQVEAIGFRAILEFCCTDTTCMEAILEAMFVERNLRFRAKKAAKGIRERKTAIVLKSESLRNSSVYRHPITVSSSYSFSEIYKLEKSGGVPDENMKKFINRITPQHLRDVKVSRVKRSVHELCHVPIGVHECLVPGIHHDLRFLKIIANVDAEDKIFLNPHCQAIMQHTWTKTWKMAVIDCFGHFMQLVFFAYVALGRNYISVHGLRPGMAEYGEIKSRGQWAAVMILPFWFFELLMESLQFAVHIQYGWTLEYLLDIGNLVDVCRIFVDGAIISSFILGGFGATEDFYFRVFLGAVCALKWSKMLYCLTPFRRIGLPVLPILFTLNNVKASVAITFVYYSGLAHGLLALDILPHRFSFTILHSVHFGVSGNLGGIEDMTNPDDKEDLKTWWLQLLLVLLSFALPITFMNIFIASMSNSYEHGIACMEQLYQKRRVEASFVQACFNYWIRGGALIRREGDLEERLWYCRERSDD